MDIEQDRDVLEVTMESLKATKPKETLDELFTWTNTEGEVFDIVKIKNRTCETCKTRTKKCNMFRDFKNYFLPDIAKDLTCNYYYPKI